MAPLWGGGAVRAAKQRGERIESETSDLTEDFEARRARVETATARAERAAIILIQRHEDLARAVARPIYQGGDS